MNVMILGKGFIGMKLFNYLEKQENVTVKLLGQSFIYSKADLDYTNPWKLKQEFNWIAPDVVINASGYTGRPNIDAAEYDKDNCWTFNTIVPKTIHDVCASRKVPMIHLSSGCIYNGYDKEYTEDDVPNFGLYSNESSFYSKTKHAAETLMPQAYHYRIRIPFTYEDSPRNYFNKIYGYKKLISVPNSMTCLEDFCDFVGKTLESVRNGSMHPGIYNVVNPGSATARDVIDMMLASGVKDNGWEYISVDELDTVAKRSNCKLSTKKLEDLGLALPPVQESLKRCVEGWVRQQEYKDAK